MRQGQAASRVQDRTNVVEDTLTKEDGVDKVDMSRLQPRILSTIMELQR